MGFNLGQRVRSKVTGIPVEGEIISVHHPGFWKALNEARGNNSETWDKLFPNWPTKPLYCLFLEKPQKTATFKEFKEHMEKEGVTDLLELRAQYNRMPEQQMIMYVEDDLEGIENENINSESSEVKEQISQ